jgi:hypothetical protein
VRARRLVASKDPREIQNANTLTLTDEDKFVSHVLIKAKQQQEYDDIAEASATGLAAVRRT